MMMMRGFDDFAVVDVAVGDCSAAVMMVLL